VSVGDLKQRFARPACRQLLDRLAHTGDGAIGGMGFERRWHVVLSARSCRIPATPAASLLHWRIKLSCRISPLLKSRRPRLGTCSSAPKICSSKPTRRCGASLHRQVTSYCPIFATDLTQSSKATVIFWMADPRVTASARIVLVMIQGRLWSWQVPMASRVYGERHGGDRCGLCRLHEAGRVIGTRPDCAATDVVDAELLL